MREKNNFSDVPEEDLNQHDSFSPAIGESGRIRSSSETSVEDSDRVAFLPDPTFTRLDTVQDLVIERKAEQKKTEKTPAVQENLPQDVPQENFPQDLPDPNSPQELVPPGVAASAAKPAPKIPFWKRLFGGKKTEPVEQKEPIFLQEVPTVSVPSEEMAVEPVPNHTAKTVAEPESIHLSEQETFSLGTPFSQISVTDPEPSVSQPSVTPTEQVEQVPLSVSLEDVAAHPFTDPSLTDALPPTNVPIAVQPTTVPQSQPEVDSGVPPQPTAATETPALQESLQSTDETPVLEVPTQPETLSPLTQRVEKEISPISQESSQNPKEPLQTSPVEPPSMPPQTPETPSKRKKRPWLWILLTVLIVFLGIIGGVVPVENIPVLRSIAHAMGFTPDEAKQMSFLRALLTWTDKALGLNGKLSAGPSAQGKSALFAGRWGRTGGIEENSEEAAQQNQMTRQTGKTSLFDMRALNELQRQKGRPLDQIAGTVLLQPGQQANTRAAMRDTEVSVHTEANRDKSEVYFGSDASATNREFYDGYDSIKTLKKIANPHIADGNPIDWLQQMTSRMMKADSGLVRMDKDLGTSVVGWQTATEDVGDSKAQKDLYHAWITSRMSNYTTSIMLKKTLADSSFLNAAIPTHASDSLTFGGVRIDTDSLDSDQEAWKEYLEWERKCKDELTGVNGGGAKVKQAVDNFNKLFSSDRGGSHDTDDYNVGFPKECSAIVHEGTRISYAASDFGQNIARIQSYCKAAQEGYSRLETTCRMQVENGADKCDTATLAGYERRYNSFAEYCENECSRRKAACDAQNTPENPNVCTFDEAACKSEINSSSTWTDYSSGNTEKASETEGLVLDKVGATSDYFPQITKGNKTERSTEAQDYEDQTGNVKTSLIEGFTQNSVRKNL